MKVKPFSDAVNVIVIDTVILHEVEKLNSRIFKVIFDV